MYTFEELDTLRKKKYGLISPDGKLLSCDMYEHFKVLKKNGFYPEKFEDYDDLEEYISNEYADHEASLDEDEHPEWHGLDIWSDDKRYEFQHKFLHEIYRDGWIRLGIFKPRSKPRAIEGEVYMDYESIAKPLVNEIAEMLDLEPILTVITLKPTGEYGTIKTGWESNLRSY